MHVIGNRWNMCTPVSKYRLESAVTVQLVSVNVRRLGFFTRPRRWPSQMTPCLTSTSSHAIVLSFRKDTLSKSLERPRYAAPSLEMHPDLLIQFWIQDVPWLG